MLRRLCAHGVNTSTISRVMSKRMFSLTVDQQERAFARATEIRANHHELHFPEKRYMRPVPFDGVIFPSLYISHPHFFF